MTRVYIIRHAQAEGNLLRRAQGHTNGAVTETGMLQIRALEERFKDIHIDAVYASDLLRTCTTAQAIYVPKGLPLHTNACFREYNMGVWEGRTWDEIFETDAENSDNFNWHLEKFSVEGGETAQMVLDRFVPALRGHLRRARRPDHCGILSRRGHAHRCHRFGRRQAGGRGRHGLLRQHGRVSAGVRGRAVPRDIPGR